jgi:hypothetical protein
MRVLQLAKRGKVLIVAMAAATAAACGETARTGRSPAFLVLDRLEAASGADPEEFGTVLFSDVLTMVTQSVEGQEVRVATIFGDLGRATFRVLLKNPGTVAAPTTPSTLNAVTLSRYRVVYRRADGRNTQGVDVPYAFDGGMTLTVPEDGTATGFFEIVRHAAKQEAPLRAMASNGGAQLIGTLAEVSFFGRDQAGNEVTVAGTITVSFGDFGDPQ